MPRISPRGLRLAQLRQSFKSNPTITANSAATATATATATACTRNLNIQNQSRVLPSRTSPTSISPISIHSSISRTPASSSYSIPQSPGTNLIRSSILPLLSSLSSTSTSTSTSTSPFSSPFGSLRFRTYGAEYRPSQRIRKRRHGFLNRLKSKGGRKILKRRMEKGRRFLTH